MLDCNPVGIPMMGYPFTWSHSKGTINGVEEKLYCVLVTSDWLDYYPDVKF